MTDRTFNERLILSLIRQYSALPKADLARITGLLPTTVGCVIERLEVDHLVRRGKPRRGRVGQPSVPYMLDHDGAFAFGLNVGRRSSELVLLDAILETKSRVELTYSFPVPKQIEEFATSHLRRVLSRSGKANRLAGLGVAMSSEMWSWGEVMGAPIQDLLDWRDYDFVKAIGGLLEVPI
ncbi:MAG: hypothetical protein ACR2PG_15585 [Hyphomicrobiaceae bacterium]